MDFTNIPILDTAISTVICWALFAILCSLINECVVQLKAERGRFMKKYMLQQLHDYPNGINWALKLYNHGAIDLLSRAAEKPTNEIPAPLFAETLIDVVADTHAVNMQSPAVIDRLTYKSATLNNFKAATLVLKPSDVTSFFKQAMNTAELSSANAAGITDEGLLYTNLKQKIETWYEGFSDRLSLWYKKKTRQRLFILGIVLGLILNIDSIQLFQIFNSTPKARVAIVDDYKKNNQRYAALNALAENYNKMGITTLADSQKAYTVTASLDTVKTYMASINALGQSADLPIGTQYNIFSNWKKEDTTAFILLKLLGVLVSGFAASVGAPFWFDLLKKTVKI